MDRKVYSRIYKRYKILELFYRGEQNLHDSIITYSFCTNLVMIVVVWNLRYWCYYGGIFLILLS